MGEVVGGGIGRRRIVREGERERKPAGGPGRRRVRGRIHAMDATERQVRADAAGLAAVIERAAADLALGEEPSNLVVALEAGAPPATDESRR